MDLHSPSHKAALQGLARQGRAAAGGLGWRLHVGVRTQVKRGQPLAFWAGEADEPTGGLAGARNRTGPLLGEHGSRGAGWHVILTWCGEVLEKPHVVWSVTCPVWGCGVEASPLDQCGPWNSFTSATYWTVSGSVLDMGYSHRETRQKSLPSWSLHSSVRDSVTPAKSAGFGETPLLIPTPHTLSQLLPDSQGLCCCQYPLCGLAGAGAGGSRNVLGRVERGKRHQTWAASTQRLLLSGKMGVTGLDLQVYFY